MTETCFNQTETDERAHLEHVKAKIKAELDLITDHVNAKFTDVIEMKKYLQDSKADMDHVEKISVRQSIEQMAMLGDHGAGRKRRLQKLALAPYFGRIDFLASTAPMRHPVYIGIHSFYDDEGEVHLVHDWRAPISSMFYDYELGPAHYDAPEGRKEGELVLKRQYRIEKGNLVFMLETSLNIHDEVLQKELSRTSDDKMKNIVATIQRDQNAIIRNDHAHALIIQGAAGSGKTSIALHRIAYLLYKFKDVITSNEILIISPNKVFAHYISQVLPELGEEMIKETTMEVLAAHLLAHKIKFQTFAEQVATLLETDDPDFGRRIQFKATTEFVSQLETYALYVKNHNVRPQPLTCHGVTLDEAWVETRFLTCATLAPAKQLVEVTQAAVEWLENHHRVRVTPDERTDLRNQLKTMFRSRDLKVLYREFYEWMGRPEMFQPVKKATYDYADVFPLIYLKIRLEGVKPHDKVKHLVIDEMQDYTPVHYRVIGQLFPCKKTILGDSHQSVNPLSSSAGPVIRDLLTKAECMTMNKSYRSTVQITNLAQRILHNPDLIPIERHGEEPEIIGAADARAEIQAIRDRIEDFFTSDDQSFGIICKSPKQAKALYKHLDGMKRRVHLLTDKSTVFSNGVVIATAHLAKGLEFDRILVPRCTAENYRTDMDRHLLYVACTRAMHNLCLTHVGPLTSCLD